MNLYTALELLTEMGRRLFTLFLVIPARLMNYKIQKPHAVPAGLEVICIVSIIQEKKKK